MKGKMMMKKMPIKPMMPGMPPKGMGMKGKMAKKMGKKGGKRGKV